MVNFIGSYKLIKSENFEEYMKAVGVGAVMRKLGATATPTATISQVGEEWRIKTETTFKTTDIKFKLNVEFDEETADGRKCKSNITLQDGNKLVHVQKVRKKLISIS
jgi:fatty acid-binding protein 3